VNLAEVCRFELQLKFGGAARGRLGDALHGLERTDRSGGAGGCLLDRIEALLRTLIGVRGGEQAAARAATPVRPFEAMQSIAQSAAGGTTKLELQLEPAHLGKIHVTLQSDASKQLQMHLTVEHAATRQVIEQHLPQLRAALEQQGLSLDNFSLHTGSQQQHQQQQQQQAFEFATRTGKGGSDYAPDSGPQIATATASASASSRLSIHI